MIDLPSPNHDARPGGADILILHYTGMQSAQAAVDRLRDTAARVSSHYVVDEDGTVLRLVPEERRAWHAGVSFWRGRHALNDVSVGIEIVNPGHEWGYRPFPDAQIQAVTALCQDILARWPIPPQHVVGHSDVAPTRKQDPGELFPWGTLAAAGVGLFPGNDDAIDETDEVMLLSKIGYNVAEEPRFEIIKAFQRHWQPNAVTGIADDKTLARLRSVATSFIRNGPKA